MQELFNFHPSGLRRLVFKNASAIILGRVINLILAIVSSVLITRYLGSDRLGQYASLYAYIALFGWLTTLGIDQIIVRESAKHKEQAEQIFATATAVSCLLSVGATLLAIVGSLASGYVHSMRLLLFIAAIEILLLSPLKLLGLIFQLSLKQWYAAGISIARQMLWVIVIGALILTGAGLPGVILGRLLCSGLEALAILLFSRRLLPFKLRLDTGIARSILKSSWPIALSGLSISIYQRVDQILLHVLSGNRALGYYVAAVNISELFGIFAAALTSTMFPLLSEVASQKDRFEYYIKICFRYLMSLLFGICAVVTVSAPFMVRIFYGKAFISSGTILSTLIWSEAGVFLGVVICTALISQGLQKYVLISTFVGALVNLALNLLWIPKWGNMGAAWATVISYNLAGFFIFFIFPKTRGICIIGAKESIAPFFIGLASAAIFVLSHKSFVIVLVPFVYLSALFALKIWKISDIYEIFAIFKTKEKY